MSMDTVWSSMAQTANGGEIEDKLRPEGNMRTCETCGESLEDTETVFQVLRECPDCVDFDESRFQTPDGTELTPIRAHEANDGLYYCWFDDDRWDWDAEKVEVLFYKCDDEERVTDSLTPEGERVRLGEDAPIVGHIEHTQGEIERITFDLTEWYGEDATYEFDGLPDWPSNEMGGLE